MLSNSFRTLGIILPLIAVAVAVAGPTALAEAEEKPVTSRIEKLDNGDMFVVQEFVANAPVKRVWDAYTTSAGWRAWVAPVAEVDLRVGGTIKTSYREGGKVTDDDANTLHVVNYFPERMLTLQAQLSPNWPDILKAREKQLFNVITFEPLSEGGTRVVSYGIGYRDTPELLSLLEFFVPANEGLYEKLIAYVESD